MQAGMAVKEVNKETWPDLEKLFEGRGGPEYCWCMAWRARGEEVKHTDRESRKAYLKARVDAGIPVGILAYQNDVPVAWCSVAPKETYRKLDDLRLNDNDEKIWSIVCFYIKKELRGTKLTHFMIAAAIKYASGNKATIIEAYPVDHDSPSYRFMGFVPVFQQHHFVETGRAGSRRHVMRLKLN